MPVTIPDIKLPPLGYVLHNGATVVQSRLHRHQGIVVLAQWTVRGGQVEYVTWRASGQYEYAKHNDTSWGHYHTDFAKAVADFEER